MSALAGRLVANGRLHGVSLALVDGDGKRYSTGFGYARPASFERANGATRYRAGSLAKLFTATAVMQLEERQAIDIDQPVWTYLPGFTIGNRFTDLNLITLRNLLSHTGGLPCDVANGMWSEQPFTRVSELLRREQLAYPPDYVTAYSNVAYSLLGQVIETASDTPFATYMTRHVFAPLGMARTDFDPKPPATGIAQGFRGTHPEEPMPIRDLPALGLVTSVDDLALFIDWVLNGRPEAPLRRGTLARMLEPQNDDVQLDFDARIGLAWSLDPGTLQYAGTVARHGGNTPLFTAELIILPEHKLGVAVLTNRGNARQELRYLAESALRIALERRGLAPPPRATSTVPVASGKVPPEANGRYLTELGVLRIDATADVIHAERLGRPYPLTGYGDGSFGVRPGIVRRDAPPELKGLSRIRFEVEQVGGRTVLVAHTGNARRLFGDRIPDGAVPASWDPFLGDYRIVNGNTAVRMEDLALRKTGDLLYLEYRTPRLSPALVRQPLGPVTDREAIILGLGRGCGETVAVSNAGGVRRLHFSGYDAVRIADH